MAKAASSKATPGQMNSQELGCLGSAFWASGGCVFRFVPGIAGSGDASSGADIMDAATVGVASAYWSIAGAIVAVAAVAEAAGAGAKGAAVAGAAVAAFAGPPPRPLGAAAIIGAAELGDN